MHLFDIWLGCEGASLEVHEPTNDRSLQLTGGPAGLSCASIPPRAYTRGGFCARLRLGSYKVYIIKRSSPRACPPRAVPVDEAGDMHSRERKTRAGERSTKQKLHLLPRQ